VHFCDANTFLRLKKKMFWAGVMAVAVEGLISKLKALSSSSQTAKTQKQKHVLQRN
jgi:hypothetical protein